MPEAPTTHLPPGPPAGVYRKATGVSWPPPPIPQAEDLERAARLVATAGPPTPLQASPGLSEVLGRRVLLKLEPESPIRSFKHRGALMALKTIAEVGGSPIVVTASTGNHGQGVAYAASLLGFESIVLSPSTTADVKIDAMRALGADVRIQGENLGQSQAMAEELSSRLSEGVYIEDGENPDLMSGAGTLMMEILDTRPDVDTVVVPVGGGNLIAGCLLAKQIAGSSVEVIGVQSSAASGVTRSWLEGRMTECRCDTFAGGLATTRPGHLSLEVMINLLETMAVVDEHDLYDGIKTTWELDQFEIEGAAAASIAAAKRFPDLHLGETVVLIVTGSWLSAAEREIAINGASQA